jgi:hypothetical protein
LLVRNVLDCDLSKVGLTGDRAERTEVSGLESNSIMSAGGIGERFQPCVDRRGRYLRFTFAEQGQSGGSFVFGHAPLNPPGR